jgi:hypothetical protein
VLVFSLSLSLRLRLRLSLSLSLCLSLSLGLVWSCLVFDLWKIRIESSCPIPVLHKFYQQIEHLRRVRVRITATTLGSG